mmetsp:Transcript_25188/g.27924  ORF Transcript_25188/g.27924 Transcript_25188/m.27924 type:complete len:228 (+) Transcript_25188:767-1450(+)
MITRETHVPADRMAAVIGTKFANILAIQEKTNTQITTPDRESSSTKIYIVGAKADVANAKAAIKNLVLYDYCKYTHPGYVRVDVAYPHDLISLLIGTKGQTIKSIQGNSKCNITIPKIYKGIVNVVGPKHGCESAKKQIENLLAKEEAAPRESRGAPTYSYDAQDPGQGEDYPYYDEPEDQYADNEPANSASYAAYNDDLDATAAAPAADTEADAFGLPDDYMPSAW